MKSISFRFALVAILAGLTLARAYAAEQPRAVVELFTSQGCSSCPAADRILAEYAAKDDVLALSWHVDYWNYLGWSDTFSSKEATQRQHAYARAFRRRGVYTPQAVVNGRDHAVGSRKPEIEALMKKHGKGAPALPAVLEMIRDNGDVRITAKSDADEANLLLVCYDTSRDVRIERGENADRTITYHNVVRNHATLAATMNGTAEIALPMDELKRRGTDACAVLLQQMLTGGLPGPIIGAAVISDL